MYPHNIVQMETEVEIDVGQENFPSSKVKPFISVFSSGSNLQVEVRWSHWFQFFLEDKIFRWKWRRAQLSWQAWPVWSKMCPASRYVRWHVVTQSVKECKACHHGTQSVIRWHKMPQSVIQCHKYQQGIGWGLTKYHKVSPSVISSGSVRGSIWQLRGLPKHTEQQLQGRNHLKHGHHHHCCWHHHSSTSSQASWTSSPPLMLTSSSSLINITYPTAHQGQSLWRPY